MPGTRVECATIPSSEESILAVTGLTYVERKMAVKSYCKPGLAFSSEDRMRLAFEVTRNMWE